MSSDYNPRPIAVAPAADSVELTASGAADYGTVAASSTEPSGDSVSLRDSNKFSRIGHDQTDAAAVAAAMPKTINVNGSVIGSGSFDSSGVADVVVAAPKP